MTAPVTDTGALYVTPPPFTDEGFRPDSELGASANILLENSRKRTAPEGESGEPDEPEGQARSRHARLAKVMRERVAQWRLDRGVEQSATAIAAAASVAREVPGNGAKWEEIYGSGWDHDENGVNVLRAGARNFQVYLYNC